MSLSPVNTFDEITRKCREKLNVCKNLKIIYLTKKYIFKSVNLNQN